MNQPYSTVKDLIINYSYHQHLNECDMIYWAHNQPIAGLPGLRISLSKSNDMFIAAKCSLMLINEEKNSLDYSEKKP